jgi:pilus assembly protein CpaB
VSPRQRRGLLLLALSVVALIFTFSAVLRYTNQVASQLGPRRPVLVVVGDVPAFAPIGAAQLGVRDVPVVFAPPGALRSYDDVAARVSPVPLTPGTFLQDDSLIPAPALRGGSRALVLPRGESTTWPEPLTPGDRVDVVAAYSDGGTVSSRVEAPGVRVLSVGERVDDRGRAIDNRVIVLEVSAEQAQAITRARAGADRIAITLLPPPEVQP